MYRRSSTVLALTIALILVAGLTACGPKDAPEPAPLMEVEEVVHLTLMLAGEAARGINGQAINLDGGKTVW